MIIKATIKDIEQINKLLYQVHKVHSDARNDIFKDGMKKYNNDELVKILNDENKPIFVYKENDVILGYAFLKIKEYKNDPSLTDRVEVYIDDLCVDENHRNKGIGTKLYDFVKVFAKNINADAITLNVWCFNGSAMKFYEKIGLKPLKVILEDKLKAYSNE